MPGVLEIPLEKRLGPPPPLPPSPPGTKQQFSELGNGLTS